MIYLKLAFIPGVVIGLDLPENHPLGFKAGVLSVSTASLRLFLGILIVEVGLCDDVVLDE